MTRLLAIFLIGLGLGGGFGFFVAAANGITLDGHDHDAHAHGPAAESAHEHGEGLDVPLAAAPQIELHVTPDPEAGWNLHVAVANFRFAPQNAGKAHVAGEGHGHVYVNGEKVARLYGEWMHLGPLPTGAEIEVTLNTNDHRQLSVGGQPVAAMVTLGQDD